MTRYTPFYLILGLLFAAIALAAGNHKSLLETEDKGDSHSIASAIPGIEKYKLPALPAGDRSSISYTGRGVFVLFGVNSSTIYNEDLSGSDSWDVNSGIGYSFEVGYLMKFYNIRMLGVGFGLGYSSYSTEIGSGEQSAVLPVSTDIDGDVYTRLINTSTMKEELQLAYFDIPVFLEFSNANIDKFGFYGRLGVKVSFPVSSSFDASGTASYQGWYDQYNVILYGIPELGFYDNKEIYEETPLALSSVNISAIASLGISYPLSSRLIMKLGASATYGLTEISESKAEGWEESMYDGNYSKLLEDPNSPTTTRAFGIEIGLIYNMRLY